MIDENITSNVRSESTERQNIRKKLTPEEKRERHRSYCRKYDHSKRGRAAKRKYGQSESGKTARRKYEQSEHRKAYKRKYSHSERGRATRRKCEQSEHGKATKREYLQSERYRTTREKYLQSKHGKTTREKYSHSERRKSASLKYCYGLKLSDAIELLGRQDGKCAVCGKKLGDFLNSYDKREGLQPNIDHCHKTGKTRGVLCHHCNIGLGYFKDNSDTLRAAIKYLEAAVERKS